MDLFNRIKSKLTLETVTRIVADAALINIGLIVSLVARLLYILATATLPSSFDTRQVFWDYVYWYANNAWLLTLICLVSFYLFGFYTRGRFYQGRFKSLVVLQAVSLAYVIFLGISYLSQSAFLSGLQQFASLPRVVLLLSWALSVVLLESARAWATFWERIHRLDARASRPIRRVLVIGGAGFIGSALLPKLLEKGYEVRILDMLLYGPEPIQPYLDHPNLELIQADFRQVDKVVQAMREVDAVVHLGAIVGDPACDLDEQLTLDINVVATRTIAEVAKGSGVSHFIFASTISVYGANDETLDERAPLSPMSLYAKSKVASEKVLFKMTDANFAPIVLRFGTVFGLSGRVRFDLVVNLLTAKAVSEGQITINGGEQWRSFVHVDDAALAIMAVLQAPLEKVGNQIFNVASDIDTFTIRKVGEMIHQHVPQAELVVNPNKDKANYKVSSAKIFRQTGYRPLWTVDQGIEQVMEAVRSGRVKNYKDARYSNVKFLSEERGNLASSENQWAIELINDAVEV